MKQQELVDDLRNNIKEGLTYLDYNCDSQKLTLLCREHHKNKQDFSFGCKCKICQKHLKEVKDYEANEAEKRVKKDLSNFDRFVSQEL